MTNYTPSGWWNTRAQFRQHLQTAPQTLTNRKPLTIPVLPAPVKSSPMHIDPLVGNRHPELAKIISRLQGGARIEQTAKGYRLTDKGHRKVKAHIVQWLSDHDFILKHITGQFAPTFKATQWVKVGAA